MDVYGVIRKKERHFATGTWPIEFDEDFSCRTTVQFREGMVLLSS